MARGISETDVHIAADTVLAAGERPTVERIRAHLGTGSPNTVTRWLDTWWQELSARLTAQHAKLALPDAPPAFTALASQLWEQALEQARAEASAALEQDRLALADAGRVLDNERSRLQRDAEIQRSAVASAQQAQALAEARMLEAQRLIEQQAVRLSELAEQRDVLQTRLDRLETDHVELGARLQQHEAISAEERKAQGLHLRAVEDRAHIEVDRTRLEAKELRGQLEAIQRERLAHEQAVARRQEDARTMLTEVQREAATQRTRADMLERQLSQLADLPAALQATLAQAREVVPSNRGARRAPKAAPTKPRVKTRSG